MSDRRARDSLLDAFAEVAKALGNGRRADVVVIDVRPTTEFAAGHIAGTRSIPIDDLAANINDLPAAS